MGSSRHRASRADGRHLLRARLLDSRHPSADIDSSAPIELELEIRVPSFSAELSRVSTDGKFEGVAFNKTSRSEIKCNGPLKLFEHVEAALAVSLLVVPAERFPCGANIVSMSFGIEEVVDEMGCRGAGKSWS